MLYKSVGQSFTCVLDKTLRHDYITSKKEKHLQMTLRPIVVVTKYGLKTLKFITIHVVL